MHADICEADDTESLARFKAALAQLGAEGVDRTSDLGVNTYLFRIGGEVLTVYSDDWSIDVEGPEQLVLKVLEAFRAQGPGGL